MGVEGGDRAIEKSGELVVAQRGDVLRKLERVHVGSLSGER
ncbi:hypothetical protein ACIBI9_49050 [Nonomuraea sp. NPDC050451]